MLGMHMKENRELPESAMLRWQQSLLRAQQERRRRSLQRRGRKGASVLKGQKKAAKRMADNIEFSDEEDEPPKRFTVYLDIEGPKSATTTNFRLFSSSKKALSSIIQMIPFPHSKILLPP
jgi:hypothetical protein